MINELFVPSADGYNVTAPGLLLLCAATVYGDPAESTPTGIKNARAILNGILSLARKGGFTQCDILETLLSKSSPTSVVAPMAIAACSKAGHGEIRALFEAGTAPE